MNCWKEVVAAALDGDAEAAEMVERLGGFIDDQNESGFDALDLAPDEFREM